MSYNNVVQSHTPCSQVGYPLVVTLVCLLDDDSYSASVDTMAEFFLKQIKSKELRALAARCLVQLACSYLVRYGQVRA